MLNHLIQVLLKLDELHMGTRHELEVLEVVRALREHRDRFRDALEIQRDRFHLLNMVGSCSCACNALKSLDSKYLVVVLV